MRANRPAEVKSKAKSAFKASNIKVELKNTKLLYEYIWKINSIFDTEGENMIYWEYKFNSYRYVI